MFHKFVSLPAVLLIVGFTALAQTQDESPREGRRGPGRPGRRFGQGPGLMFQGPFALQRLLRSKDVQKELELVEEQKKELRALYQEMRGGPGERPNLRDLSDKERRERIKEMRKEHQQRMAKMEEKIKAILLPHQLQRLNQIRLQVAGDAALMEPEVQKELGITKEQKEKMKALHKDGLAKFREAWEDLQDLLPEQRREQRDEIRSKMEKLQKELSEKLMGVLTSEQKEKYEALKGEKFEFNRAQLFGFGNREQNPERPGGPKAEDAPKN
jgi:hypothetical protein